MGISHNFNLGFIFEIYFSCDECIAPLKLMNGWINNTPLLSPFVFDALKGGLLCLLKRFLFFKILKPIHLVFTQKTYMEKKLFFGAGSRYYSNSTKTHLCAALESISKTVVLPF